VNLCDYTLSWCFVDCAQVSFEWSHFPFLDSFMYDFPAVLQFICFNIHLAESFVSTYQFEIPLWSTMPCILASYWSQQIVFNGSTADLKLWSTDFQLAHNCTHHSVALDHVSLNTDDGCLWITALETPSPWQTSLTQHCIWSRSTWGIILNNMKHSRIRKFILPLLNVMYENGIWQVHHFITSKQGGWR